jgi:FMN-dependent NADH-azoreductase
MPVLLQLDSSADATQSTSRALTKIFADTWRAAGPEFLVTYRDLHAEPLPHLADASLHWPPRLRRADADTPAAGELLQSTLLSELIASDVLLVGVPLYNYSMPSTLKAWLDNIHVPGVTASFDSKSQPMKGRPAVLLVSRGADYSPGGPSADWDHAVPPLQLVLGNSLGMAVSVVSTDLTLAEQVPAMAGLLDQSRAQLAAAQSETRQLAQTLAGSFG